MAGDQLTRMSYRRDQILQLPFPQTPSLSRQIDNGVLKKPGAVQYDEALQRHFESIQNILKLAFQWPKFDDLKRQFDQLAETVSELAEAQSSITGMEASITSLQSQVAAQQLSIASALSSVANLTAAINDNSIPMIVYENSGENPIFPPVVGISGIFGSQRAHNRPDQLFWTWSGSEWALG